MVERAIEREEEMKRLKEEGCDSEGELPSDEINGEEEREYEYE